jgi:hypothetical protein
MTETPDTIDPQTEAAEPKFSNCWVDDEREIIMVEIGGVTFRLRSITVGEERRIADELAIEVKVPDVSAGDVPAVIKLGDFTRRMILNVGAALGMWHKYSSEGWSDSRPLTTENVEALKGDVLTKLWLEHVKYFRHV